MCCTTPEFDELRAELKLNLPGFKNLEGFERGKIRAELDAIIAHLYGLTESEFAHILKTFPIVKKEVTAAAMAEFKKIAGEK
jgi:hypothetical protein